MTRVAFADRIMEITKEIIDGPAPVLTAFGVDLLYPGLDLEIDAMAIVDPGRKILSPDCPVGHPAMTAVRVHESAKPGLLIQADCIALK